MTGQKYMEWFADKYGFGRETTYTPEEMLPILQAKEKRDYEAVVRGCNGVIAKDSRLFDSLPYANWVKSNAYIERGWAKFVLTQNLRALTDDETKAAELGNLRAARDLSQRMLEKYQGKAEAAAIDVNPRALEKYLRIGAELGDSQAARFLGIELWPNPLGPSEKAYWSLVGIGRTTDLSAEGWDRIIHVEFEKAGEPAIELALTNFSPLGGLTVSGPELCPVGVSSRRFSRMPLCAVSTDITMGDARLKSGTVKRLRPWTCLSS